MPREPLTSPAAEPISQLERVRSALIDAIETGTLLPGRRIDEKELASRFEVSRTPVREALLMLAAQGLVRIAPRSGIHVASPDASEIVAMLEALAEQEAVVCRLAMQRMSSAQRKQLQQLYKATEKAAEVSDRPAYEAANRAFHGLLYEVCANEHIVAPLRLLRLRLAVFRREVHAQPARLLSAAKEHRRIVEAMLANQGDKAADAMRDHILAKGNAVGDLMVQVRALGTPATMGRARPRAVSA
jgi:DNA-binding GntR family transcriptional regulator